MNLKELIEYLEKKDRDLIVPMGFADPHAYKGDYTCLAFEPVESITIGTMLDYARNAVGHVYKGWNGADYRMNSSTEVYLARFGYVGEKMGTVLLDYMTGVYEEEEEEEFKNLRRVVNKAIGNLEGLITERDDARTDLKCAEDTIHDLVIEKKDMEHQLAVVNREMITLQGTIKEDQRRIVSLSEERTTLDRWFLNDRDTLRSIERIYTELEMCNPEHIRRDVQAIKSMSMVSDIMKDWDPSIGRSKESEGWNKNGEDILSAAVNAIRGIEAANLKTINDLLRARVEELKGTISDQNKEINELEHRNENQMESIQHQRGILKELKAVEILKLKADSAEAARSLHEAYIEVYERDRIIKDKVTIIGWLEDLTNSQTKKIHNLYEKNKNFNIELAESGIKITACEDIINKLEAEPIIRKIPPFMESLKSSARLALRQDDEITALEGIVKKQNQTILHINAELEATKQYDPFDLGLIAGSMENISNIIKDHFKPTIDVTANVKDLDKTIASLEAELAVLKGDSAVLMKVVNIVQDWRVDMDEYLVHRGAIHAISKIVKDYIDVPDESREYDLKRGII